ncbi:MAG: S8 family peptidase, partial [Candidatus Sericytochromatia bacterium]
MTRPVTHRALWALFAATLLVGCHAPQGHLRVNANAPKPAPGPWAGAKPPSSPAAAATPAVVPDQLIVALKPGVTPEAWLNQSQAAGFTLRGSLRLSGRHVLKVGIPKGLDLDAARLRAGEAEGVQRVTEDPVPKPVAFTFTQKDTRVDEQWAHQARHGNTLDAWEKVPVADQAKIIVAVLDTGLDIAHPEFAGRLVGARNFTADPPDANVADPQGHGTHVTGIVGATGNNNVGVAGVAWGVKLMPVKVLGDAGEGGTFDILQGILYAASFVPSPDDGSRVRVINMSLGTPTGGTDALYAEAIAE